MFQLRLFGSPVLEHDGAPLTGRAAQRHRLALLALLSLAPGRRLSRDRLIAYLWPERDTASARNLLKVSTHVLRAELAEGVLVSASDQLCLDDELVRTDTTEFAAALASHDYARAVELYRGPFLDGFFLDHAAEFEEWTTRERRRLAGEYGSALEQLAAAAAAAGEAPTAAEWWLKRAALEPLNTRVALQLMEALQAGGNVAAALRHAAVHETLLREELGIAAPPELVSAVERLRPHPIEPTAGQPGRDPTSGDSAVQSSHAPVHAAPALPDALPPSPAAARAVTARRVRSLTLALAGALILSAALAAVFVVRSRGAPPAARSVAVLPFVNLSPDPAHRYFSDGLSEQIISALSRVPGLRVAARTSSFALRDEKLDIRTIGNTLNVSAVLEGSVRRDGDLLRITAQLIDARSGYHLWSGDYDRRMQQVVEVQDEIARDIARALELQLPAGAVPSGSRHIPDLKAYDLYLRALYLRDTFSPEALHEARAYLEHAVALDPYFARAHALQATVLAPAMLWRVVPLEPGLAAARAAVDRALELDPGLGEAHGALATIKLFFDFDFPAAERALQRALELNENDHLAGHMLANYHTAMGKLAEAAEARARGAALDPLNPRIGIMLAVAYTDAGRFPEALAQYDRMLKLHAMHPIALGLGSMIPAGPSRVYLKQGRHREAVEDYVRVATLRGASAPEVDRLRASFQRGGMPAFWRSWLAFDLRSAGRDPDPVRVATLYTLIGDTAQALTWLERAHAERSPSLVFVFADPTFAAIRDQPRFRRIFQQLNFPGSWRPAGKELTVREIPRDAPPRA